MSEYEIDLTDSFNWLWCDNLLMCLPNGPIIKDWSFPCRVWIKYRHVDTDKIYRKRLTIQKVEPIMCEACQVHHGEYTIYYTKGGQNYTISE